MELTAESGAILEAAISLSKKAWYWNLKTFVNISLVLTIHNFYCLFEFVQDFQLLITTKGEFQLIPLIILSFSYQTVLKSGHLKSTFQLASAYLFSLVLLQNQFLPFCISSLWLTRISWNEEIELREQIWAAALQIKNSINGDSAWVVVVEAQQRLWCNHEPTAQTIAWHSKDGPGNSFRGLKNNIIHLFSIS